MAALERSPFLGTGEVEEVSVPNDSVELRQGDTCVSM